jgi:hypothetical protein
MPRIPRLRIGIAIGFGVGYYLGAKAGRERYEQLRSLVASSPLSKIQAAYELGIERLRDSPLPVSSPGPSDTVLPPSNN